MKKDEPYLTEVTFCIVGREGTFTEDEIIEHIRKRHETAEGLIEPKAAQ